MGLSPKSIPTDWDQVDAAWATAQIAAKHPGAVVDTVELLTRDDGTNMRARIGLTYAQGEGPSRLFLKQHSPEHREVHLRNGNLWVEAKLYRSGVPLGVEFPTAYRAIVDRTNLNFLIVMEDLAERGADMRHALKPLSINEAMSGVRGLARMHSLYWGFTNRSHPKLGWVRWWKYEQGFEEGLARRIPLAFGQAGDQLDADLRAFTPADIVTAWRRYIETVGKGPHTLVMGDAHVGNTYVLPDGTTGFLDFTPRRGNWAQDVGYFLVGALVEEDRRKADRDLIAAYRDALDVPDKPSLDTMWTDYRGSHAYGLAIWLSTLGAGPKWQRPEICIALSERYMAAFREMDTPGALAEIEARYGKKSRQKALGGERS